MTHGRDSPKVGWVTNGGQLGWKLGVQQVSQYVTVDCVYYTGATNLHDVIALVHPSCACPPRVAVYINTGHEWALAACMRTWNSCPNMPFVGTIIPDGKPFLKG